MIPRPSAAARPAASFLAAALLACGGGSSPSTPSTPPATTPPATLPPTPVDPPLSASCNRLNLGTASGKEKCGPESPNFFDDLDRSIDTVIAQRPDIFDLNQFAGPGGYKVLSEGAFFVAVIQDLDKQGLCGGIYGEELAVTNINDYSDNFDIIDAKHYIRRGTNSYRSTCVPASFTTPQAPAGLTPGCKLPASVSLSCGRENQAFLQVVEDAIVQLSKEQPGIFDFRDIQTGTTDWWRVNDPAAYTQGVVKIILARGLCARWDGEELNVKANNVSSDNYDILTAQGHVRRGEGSYRVTCYPAYF